MRTSTLGFLGLTAAIAVACSTPSINGLIFSCSTDADCSGGKVCGDVNGARGCVDKTVANDAGPDVVTPVDSGQDAASPTDIRLGMSAAFTGTSASLGLEMRRGISAYLKAVNDGGGVHGGRHLALQSLDDHYDPATAVLNVEQLLDIPASPLLPDGGPPTTPDTAGPNSVFAVIGNVGTPTMVQTFPIITKAKTIIFGQFTGSQKYLRDGTNSPYSFNFRAGYYDETAAMLDYFFTTRAPQIRDYRNIIVFAQGDTYGDAGYNGIVNAYKASGHSPALPSDTAVTRVNYVRDDVTSVPGAVANTTTWPLSDAGTGPAYNLESIFQTAQTNAAKESVAIVMVDTYAIGAQYIKGVKDYVNKDSAHASLLDVTFIHVSFVGPDALASALQTLGTYPSVLGGTKSYSEGVMVTQVVPFYNAQSAGVVQYRNDLKALDQGAYNSTSLEGYLATKLFVEGLKKAPSVDTAALITTFESMPSVDLGIGVILGFSPASHSASHNVWLSQLDASSVYTFPYRWDPTGRIQPN